MTSEPLEPHASAPAAPEPSTSPTFRQRHSVLVYTVSRLVLFLVVLGLLFLAGLRSYVLLVVALLVSGAASLVLLSSQRDAMSSSVTGTFRRINDKIDASTRAEDGAEPASTPPPTDAATPAGSDPGGPGAPAP